MSKKHFVAIAAAIYNELTSADNDDQKAGIRNTAQALANEFAEFNANFDKARFLTACGL